jgi:hypothetical protein
MVLSVDGTQSKCIKKTTTYIILTGFVVMMVAPIDGRLNQLTVPQDQNLNLTNIVFKTT